MINFCHHHCLISLTWMEGLYWTTMVFSSTETLLPLSSVLSSWRVVPQRPSSSLNLKLWVPLCSSTWLPHVGFILDSKISAKEYLTATQFYWTIVRFRMFVWLTNTRSLSIGYFNSVDVKYSVVHPLYWVILSETKTSTI